MAETAGLNQVIKGPGHWLRASDPWYLKESFGQQMSFRNICAAARAAKLRVLYKFEAARRLNPDTDLPSIYDMKKKFAEAWMDSSYPSRRTKWGDWYCVHFASILERNSDAP